MKKIFLISLVLLSCLCAKSVEELQSEWYQKMNTKVKEAQQYSSQNDEVKRLTPHCFRAKDEDACERLVEMMDKFCKQGDVMACFDLAKSYAQVDDTLGVKRDLNLAQKYVDKICQTDGVVCAAMSGLFMYVNRKLALKYATKACEMGELADCVVAAELYSTGFGGINKDPKKVKYYNDKLCKGGISEACK